jgi:hypothetical protein
MDEENLVAKMMVVKIAAEARGLTTSVCGCVFSSFVLIG